VLKTKVLLVIVAVLSLSWAVNAAQSPLAVRSRGIAVNLDAHGRITAIKNLITGANYPVSADDCRIVLDSATISLSDVPMKLSSNIGNSIAFTGSASGLEITRVYTAAANRGYFNRDLSIKNISGKPIVVKTIMDCSLVFAKPFASAAFHDDNMSRPDMLYETSVNVFMRNPVGGLCAGLKYPYFKPDIANDHVSLYYEPNYRLKPGEKLDLPTMFVAAYKKLGCTVRKAITWKTRVLSMKQEEMDLGEVRAMQQVMGDYLTEYPLPKDGYYLWLNCYWADKTLRGRMDAQRADGYIKLMDEAKMAKCLDLVTIGSVWCGWGLFIKPAPEIDAVGADAVLPRNPFTDRVVEHAQSLGLATSGFCEPNAATRHYRKDHPDFRIQPKPNGPTVADNCHANPEYEDWFYKLTCSAIDTYHLQKWAWDHSWMKRPMICYNPTHGHEPGNCEFDEYRNVTDMIMKLRQRYPRELLEIYWGLKEAGPWSLRGLSSLENLYENGQDTGHNMSIADDLRFQHWYNHNYRFIPTHLDLAQIYMTRERNGHLYSILSALSASTHASLADWTPFTTQSEADKIFAPLRRWKAWANANQAYLRDRVDLFGQPIRTDGIDGTAHIIGDKGFIFVFNPWPEEHWGSIPLTDTIGLEKGSKFSLDNITGDAPKRLGVYKKGDNFVFPIPGKSAMLIELKPTNDAISHIIVPTGTKAQPAFPRY